MDTILVKVMYGDGIAPSYHSFKFAPDASNDGDTAVEWAIKKAVEAGHGTAKSVRVYRPVAEADVQTTTEIEIGWKS